MPSTLPQALDAAAARTPGHEAVRCNGSALTYAELSERSDRLAAALVAEGVRRGDRVGLYLNKGLHATVALYGIMKAGAAYVPLDASAPPARLAFILRDCAIRCLVTAPGRQDVLARILAEGTPVEVCIGLEADPSVRAVPWGAVEATPARPDVEVTARDLAYVLYTSGSTGVPKGVVHTHASGLAYARFTAETHGFRPDDRVSNYTLLHFDPSTLDYYAAAVAGATTIVIPEMYTKLPASLSSLLADERVTIFFAVPFAYTQLALRGALDKRDLSALRWALFSGEPMPPRVLRDLMAAWPHARFGNIYGPTELNGVTYHIVPEAPADDAPVPIGEPYPGVEVRIVDASGEPVAAGTPGELLVRSPTRMVGYWGRPELDAAAFVEAGDGGAYYRTGDLVRRDADGVLHFLGRKDRQVKTRGYRVELAEVEAALASHAAVDAAAAFTVPDEAGSHRILAAVSAEDAAALSLDALGAHARACLPAYAVPEAMAVLPSFPRTPTGKLDRQQIQALATRQLFPGDPS